MKLTPDWIVGFVDGEGSFCVSLQNMTSMTHKKQVRLIFKVSQHYRNVQTLYALKTFFGVGIVKSQTRLRRKTAEPLVDLQIELQERATVPLRTLPSQEIAKIVQSENRPFHGLPSSFRGLYHDPMNDERAEMVDTTERLDRTDLKHIPDTSIWEYTCSRFEHLEKVIIPFFEKHQLHTSKQFDFRRFRRASILIKRNHHLTQDGLLEIERIRRRMVSSGSVYPLSDEESSDE